MKKIKPAEIKGNPTEMIGKGWMLVTAGTPDSFNTMTASWGTLGELWNKPIAFVFVRPQRHTFLFTEKEPVMTLSFFDEKYRKALQICGTTSGRNTDKVKETGLTPFETESGSVSFREASLILECRKLYADRLKADSFIDKSIISSLYPESDFHMVYACEIINVWVNE